MNLLLFEQNEMRGNILQIADRRSEHVLHVLKLQPGDVLKAGLINGKTGPAKVIRIEPPLVELEVHLENDPPAEPLMELILALPRPIMLQRILKQATVLGVRRFHLIRSRRVQKSFFQASILQPEGLKGILLQGLEQTMDTRLPTVHIHDRFKPFVEDFVPAIDSTCRLIAHPGTKKTLPELHSEGIIARNFVLAIGPEGGWSEYEVEKFSEKGFHCFSMGNRILHVDTAVVALLSQLRLLGDLL